MAEKAIQERQYDREGRRRTHEPSGAAESLRGKPLPKMGDRAILVSEEVQKRKEKKEQL